MSQILKFKKRDKTTAKSGHLVFAVAVVSAFAVVLPGCALVPAYQRPDLPGIGQYSDVTLPEAAGQTNSNTSQKFLFEGDLASDWWVLFQSDALNKLIATALQANPELNAAEASIRKAQENHHSQRSVGYPSVDLNVGVDRQEFSGASVGFPETPSTLFTLYNASVDVSYNVDLFGKADNIELLAKYQLDQAQWKREATYLALTANVVNQYIHISALDDEIQDRKQVYAIEQERFELLEKDAELGGTASKQLLVQSDRVFHAHAASLATEKKRAFAHHQLAILIGNAPAELNLESLTLRRLQLPNELPVSLPSQLVRQRPDIQLAESLIKANHAELGIAIANQLPHLTLSGSYGTLSSESSAFFDPASVVWNIGTGLTQPLFHGGALKHRKKSAEAALEESSALYRQTVLLAFKQVADSLRALDYDARVHAEAADAEIKGEIRLKLTRQEKSLGAVSHLQLLDAKLEYHLGRINRIHAQSLHLSDTVALFQALGGGWWNRQ